jgi:pimeloyl-ACP methyl ester carboxylesterase
LSGRVSNSKTNANSVRRHLDAAHRTEYLRRAMTKLVDRTVALDVNGSIQRIRMCAERAGLPPLLVVQAGPGYPLLHEAGKFQKRLNLEREFLVCYWDQRGCGNASKRDAQSASFHQQAADVSAVVRYLKNETRQNVALLAISLGATAALQAAGRQPDSMAFLVAISPDAQTHDSDAAVDAFLRNQDSLNGKLTKLGPPPYFDPSRLQLRAQLLADLGSIEHGKRFGALLRETLFGLIDTYGLLGTIQVLKNMNEVQRRMLPDVAALDLFANPPRPAIPVHCVFGEHDALIPVEMSERLAAAIAARTSVRLPNAGHMVHFDQPETVRQIVMQARRAGSQPALAD